MSLYSFDLIIQELYLICNAMVWYLITNEANNDCVCLVEVYFNL
jgi:hypothetical protein